MAVSKDARVARFENGTFTGLVDTRKATRRAGVSYGTIRAALSLTRDASPDGLVPGASIGQRDLSKTMGVFVTAKAVHAHRDSINAEAKLARKALKAFRAINQL